MVRKIYNIKIEWLCQLVALVIFYIDSIIDVNRRGVSFSGHLFENLMFLLYEAPLFILINYVLIPKLFYKKKYILFFLSLLGSIVLFGIVEEGVVEKILSPRSRGMNDITWRSIYGFYGEIIVPLLTFMTIKFVFDNFSQQQKLERIQKDRLNNELQLLKSQIQPHILFNSLNNLYHFALKKSDEVPDLILKLSNVLRYVLYEATEEKVLIAKELEFIKDYIDLQKIQYVGRGVIHYNIRNELKDENRKVEPFLIIPFIENSFKHSFGSKIKEVVVNIKIAIVDDALILFAENNYEEDNEDRDELVQGGIGLVNVKKRLKLLYPNQHELNIIKAEQKYIVHLNIVLS